MTIIRRAFVDDGAARKYLDSVWQGSPLPDDILPPRKWAQALFLCDGGRLPVRAKHLARLLDVPMVVAGAVERRLRR